MVLSPGQMFNKNNQSITSDLVAIPSVTSIQLNIVNKLRKAIGLFPSKNQT